MGLLRRNVWSLSLATSLSAALQYLLLFVLARFLGPADYGPLALAMTVAQLAAPFCDLGCNVSLVWQYHRGQGSLGTLLGNALALRLVLLLPIGLAGFCLAAGSGLPATTLALLPALFLAAVADGASGTCAAVHQAEERLDRSGRILLTRAWLRICAMVLALSCDASLTVLVLGQCLASLSALALGLRGVLRGHALRVEVGRLLPTLRAALPFGLAVLAGLYLLQLDVLMLGSLAGSTAAGNYHAAMRFVLLAEMLPQILSQAALPRSYRLGARGDTTQLQGFYRLQAWLVGNLGILLAVGLAWSGPWLVHAALGPAFTESGALLCALAPLLFLRFLLVPLGDALTSAGGQAMLCHAALAGLALNFALNLWWIPQHGALGACGATVCSQGLRLLIEYRALRQRKVIPGWLGLYWQSLLVWAAYACLPEDGRSAWTTAAALLLLTLWWRRRPGMELSRLLRIRAPARALPTR